MKQHVLRFSMFIDAIKMQFAQIFYIYIYPFLLTIQINFQ